MDAEARLRYYKGSPQKVRLVANTVRGRGVAKALAVLKLTNKRCARDLERLLRSAVANLEQKSPGIDSGRLVLKSIQVDSAPSLKRFRAASMGRVFPRIHRFCHVTVRVAEREE
ncbi:MAG TPA: 50S ribosomal protein L22 [Thermoanaerobaculaceae bacterium]|nr:50S ribosomal protein L22 [Thermoanaerobaculaceae bacterium]